MSSDGLTLGLLRDGIDFLARESASNAAASIKKIGHCMTVFYGKPLPMVTRSGLLESIRGALGRAPVTMLTGPRPAGKTTLARELLPETSPSYFDLEAPFSLARLDGPMTALAPLRGLVVIDRGYGQASSTRPAHRRVRL